jgi:hypothetical protein
MHVAYVALHPAVMSVSAFFGGKQRLNSTPTALVLVWEGVSSHSALWVCRTVGTWIRVLLRRLAVCNSHAQIFAFAGFALCVWVC